MKFKLKSMISCTEGTLVRGFIFALLFCALSVSVGQSQLPVPREYEVKAAFLYNFAKFIEWPGDSSSVPVSSIVIGILGEDPFGVDLENTIRGKTINGKELVVKRGKTLRDLGHCHVLFISESENPNVKQVLQSLKNSGTVTVADMKDFTRQGGMINFILESNKVRFQINVDAAEREKLRFSSQLLKLAHITRESE